MSDRFIKTETINDGRFVKYSTARENVFIKKTNCVDELCAATYKKI